MKTETQISQYEKRERVLFRWWRDDHQAIPANHLDALEEHARERIYEMTKEGYQSGELVEIIYDHETGDEHEYSGWWDVTEEG